MQIADPIVFSSLEEANAFPHGWDLEFYALQRGQNEFCLERLEGRSTVINVGRFNGPTLQMGSTPEGMKTFALSPCERDNLAWHGYNLDARSLMVFGADRDLYSTSRAAVDIYTVSVELNALEALAAKAGMEPSQGSSHIVPMTDSGLANFYRDYLLLAGLINRGAGEARDFDQRLAVMEEQLHLDLIGATGSSEGNETINIAKSYRNVNRAMDYIMAHLRNPIKITAVSQYLGMSVRTLELHFKKHLGVSPKQVINLLRLSAVRRDLLRYSKQQTNVAAIADSWGYWHLGQFSRDYRLAFGEKPSASLARQAD